MNAGIARPSFEPHARAERVEDPHDARVDAVSAVVGHRDRLGEALGLVVHAARPDRVDVAPVVLALGMDERIAVDLGGRGEQEARALRLGDAERVVGAERADLQASGSAARGSRRATRGSRSAAPSRACPSSRMYSVTSCSTRVKPRRRLDSRPRLSREPVTKSSMQTTSQPLPRKNSQRCEPMKPAPPVTSTAHRGVLRSADGRDDRSE